MEGLSYPERLTVLKLYSLQHRREIHYYLCVEDLGKVWSLIFSLLYVLKHCIVDGGPVLRHTLMLEDWEHWSITALDDMPSVCLTN